MKNLLIILSLVMLPACGGDNFAYPDYEPDTSLGGEPDHGARPTGGNMQVASGSADGAGGSESGGTGGAMSTGGDPGSGGDLGAGGDPGSGGGEAEEPEDSGYEIHYAGVVPHVSYGYCGVAQQSSFCANQPEGDADKVWFFQCTSQYQPSRDVLTCKRTPNTDYWCCAPVEYFHPQTGWPPEN